MKVALISSAYHPYYKGGGEFSVKHLAEGLVQRGEEVFVITAYHKATTEQINGVQVYRIKHPNIYWSFESDQQPAYRKLAWHIIEGYNPNVARPVKDILMREKPDVLHVRNAEDFSPYVCRVAQELKIPVVVTLNSYTWLCPKATMFRNGRNCQQQCLDCKLITYPKKYLSKYVDMVVGVSQFMVDVHTTYHYFPKAKKEVVYTSSSMHALDLPAQKNGFITFGYIGRIHPTKGVHQIIKAFISLPLEHKLLIAGEGPEDYVHQCQVLAENRSNIIFLGKYNAEDFYKQVDVVVISSLWHEPFPRVLTEAYSFGRPVTASNTGGISEMISGGETGYLFDPQQDHQLAELMSKFIRMNYKQLQRMQENVKKFFSESFQDDVQMYVNLYQSLRS